DDSVAECLLDQIWPIDKLAVAIAGVATAVARCAVVLRNTLIGKGPVAKRAAFLMMPKATLGRAAEVVAVEVAGERLAATQMHNARMGRVARVVHRIPVSALGDPPPAPP